MRRKNKENVGKIIKSESGTDYRRKGGKDNNDKAAKKLTPPHSPSGRGGSATSAVGDMECNDNVVSRGQISHTRSLAEEAQPPRLSTGWGLSRYTRLRV